MKKTNMFRVIGLILAIAIASPSFSQYANHKSKLQGATLIESLKNMPTGEDADKAAVANMKLINAKMHKDFTRHYRTASDIKMAETANATFISCKINNIPTKVTYNAKGRWIHTIKYLTPDQVPAHVVDIVTAEYSKFKITHAKEVHVGSRSAFLVDIENAKAFKTIRVVGDEWDVYKEFSK